MYSVIDQYQDSLDLLEKYQKLGSIEELSTSIKEEDVLKFYYCESLDKYLIGRRCDTFYYADVTDYGELSYIMSRYLPWGEHVIDPDTMWKEHTYPTKPKEISFTKWLQGFLKQRGYVMRGKE